MSGDKSAYVSAEYFTATELLYERVIIKLFQQYDLPIQITDPIRHAIRSKLWRMGKALSKLGGIQRKKLLARWKDGPDSTWKFEVLETEVNLQVLKRKRNAETQLNTELTKRRRLEKEVKKLEKTTKEQSKAIAQLRTGHSSNMRGLSLKSWPQCSRQQQYNRQQRLAAKVQGALSFCEDEGFEPRFVELKNKDTYKCDILDVTNGTYSGKENISPTPVSPQSALFIKDRYCISNEAFHELSVVSNLPSSNRVKKLAYEMNSKFEICETPSGTVGVQQSLQSRLIFCISQLAKQYKASDKLLPETIRIKLTGDGTQIARGFTVVNFAFTLLDDRDCCSAKGNHTIAILKVSENYNDLATALKDVIEEASNLNSVSVDGNIYHLQYFLGGDWKFLALVCGLESATSNHACIWCKCPKDKRWDMSMTWSLLDQEKGARTIAEINEKAKLAKSNKNRFNCCNSPLFSFIPLHQVVIDSLHLFLRIADVLINLLIRDLRTLDATNQNKRNLDAYVDVLNNCKIRFRWFTDKETKKLTWRDLTGPEKMRLFNGINIPAAFPDLQSKETLQKLWNDFFKLMASLGHSSCHNAVDFEQSAKAWVKLFTSVYQSKDVTPYMHAFAMHVHQFLSLHGNIVTFSQQGLEKLNDITTIHYHSTNHRESEALKQLLEKRNRIEELEYGYQRSKQVQKCSFCKSAGHNKRTCPTIH